MKRYTLLFVFSFSVCIACTSAPPPKPPSPAPTETTSDFSANDPARGSIEDVSTDDPGYQQGESLDQAAGVYAERIEALFAQNREAVNQCYLKELKRNPSLQGALTMEFTVVRGGHIEKGTESLAGTLKNERVRACILEMMLSLTYPEPYNGEYATVRRTLQFGAF